MNASELLSSAHVVEIILMLGESDRKLSDFLSITSNFYTVDRILGNMEEAGIVTKLDAPRSRGTWFTLTDRGRAIAGLLRAACDLIDS